MSGRRIAIDREQAFVQGRDPRAVVRRLGIDERLFDAAQLAVAVENIVERGGIQRRNFLANESQRSSRADVRSGRNPGRVRRRSATSRLDLPAPLRPLIPIAPAGVQAETDLLEQQQRAAAKREIFESVSIRIV